MSAEEPNSCKLAPLQPLFTIGQELQACIVLFAPTNIFGGNQLILSMRGGKALLCFSGKPKHYLGLQPNIINNATLVVHSPSCKSQHFGYTRY